MATKGKKRPRAPSFGDIRNFTVRQAQSPDEVATLVSQFNEEYDKQACRVKGNIPPLNPVSASTWVYPVNPKYAERKYQRDIVETALFRNTLVVLPTGLGKTFIASVVMLNFYRWFPSGKILFMAPTRALVSQQVGACHSIAGIPRKEMTDLMGTIDMDKRRVLWRQSRVIFATPQTVVNDINQGFIYPNDFVCVVVDEAHRATKRFAYVDVLNELSHRTRVVGLSATPGSNMASVQSVVDAMRIATLEVRSEADAEIKAVLHTKTEEVVVVSLPPAWTKLVDMLLALLKRYLEKLRNSKLTPFCMTNPNNVALFMLVQGLRQLHNGQVQQGVTAAQFHDTSGAFSVAITLVTARDRLNYGLTSFISTVETNIMQQNKSKVKNFLKASSNFICMTDEMYRLRDEGVLHPKMEKLKEIISDHFENSKTHNTRVIIFSTIRASVSAIYKMLQASMTNFGRAGVRVGEFTGKSTASGGSKGQTSKGQQAVISRFRSGELNVLVSTSVGEEGLDVGEVDLIVNYDSAGSAIRSIQRGGRTGRKRDGRIITLVFEGKEKTKHDGAVRKQKALKRSLTNARGLNFHESAPMLPRGVRPICEKIVVEVSDPVMPPPKKKQRTSAASSRDYTLTDEQVAYMEANYSLTDEQKANLNFQPYSNPSFLSTLTPFHVVAHSTVTKKQARVFQLAEAIISRKFAGKSVNLKALGRSRRKRARSGESSKASKSDSPSTSASDKENDEPQNCASSPPKRQKHITLDDECYGELPPAYFDAPAHANVHDAPPPPAGAPTSADAPAIDSVNPSSTFVTPALANEHAPAPLDASAFSNVHPPAPVDTFDLPNEHPPAPADTPAFPNEHPPIPLDTPALPNEPHLARADSARDVVSQGSSPVLIFPGPQFPGPLSENNSFRRPSAPASRASKKDHARDTSLNASAAASATNVTESAGKPSKSSRSNLSKTVSSKSTSLEKKGGSKKRTSGSGGPKKKKLVQPKISFSQAPKNAAKPPTRAKKKKVQTKINFGAPAKQPRDAVAVAVPSQQTTHLKPPRDAVVAASLQSAPGGSISMDIETAMTSSIVPDTWPCLACTFENARTRERCAMCNTARGKEAAHPSQVSQEENAAVNEADESSRRSGSRDELNMVEERQMVEHAPDSQGVPPEKGVDGAHGDQHLRLQRQEDNANKNTSSSSGDQGGLQSHQENPCESGSDSDGDFPHRSRRNGKRSRRMLLSSSPLEKASQGDSIRHGVTSAPEEIVDSVCTPAVASKKARSRRLKRIIDTPESSQQPPSDSEFKVPTPRVAPTTPDTPMVSQSPVKKKRKRIRRGLKKQEQDDESSSRQDQEQSRGKSTSNFRAKKVRKTDRSLGVVETRRRAPRASVDARRFVQGEAEESDDCESGDEIDDDDGADMESFIDDATQRSQNDASQPRARGYHIPGLFDSPAVEDLSRFNRNGRRLMTPLHERIRRREGEEEDSLSMGPLSENEIEDDEDDPIISIYSYEDDEGEEEDAYEADENRVSQEGPPPRPPAPSRFPAAPGGHARRPPYQQQSSTSRHSNIRHGLPPQPPAPPRTYLLPQKSHSSRAAPGGVCGPSRAPSAGRSVHPRAASGRIPLRSVAGVANALARSAPGAAGSVSSRPTSGVGGLPPHPTSRTLGGVPSHPTSGTGTIPHRPASGMGGLPSFPKSRAVGSTMSRPASGAAAGNVPSADEHPPLVIVSRKESSNHSQIISTLRGELKVVTMVMSCQGGEHYVASQSNAAILVLHVGELSRGAKVTSRREQISALLQKYDHVHVLLKDNDGAHESGAYNELNRERNEMRNEAAFDCWKDVDHRRVSVDTRRCVSSREVALQISRISKIQGPTKLPSLLAANGRMPPRLRAMCGLSSGPLTFLSTRVAGMSVVHALRLLHSYSSVSAIVNQPNEDLARASGMAVRQAAEVSSILAAHTHKDFKFSKRDTKAFAASMRLFSNER